MPIYARAIPSSPTSALFNATRVIFALAAALSMGATSVASAAPNLTLDFSGLGPDGDVNIGESLTLSVFANEIPAGIDSAGLFGFGFDLTFDNSVLSASAATEAPIWSGAGFSSSSSTANSVGLSANRFFFTSGPSGDNILLATIELTAISLGLSALDLTWFTGGAGDNTLFDFTVLDSSSSFFVGGSLNVIPEPSTGVLIGIGLAWLGARRGVPSA